MRKLNHFDSGKTSSNLLLEFKDIFPLETQKSPEEYLQGTDRETILSIISIYLRRHSAATKYRSDIEYLYKMFNNKNRGVYELIAFKIVGSIDFENGNPKQIPSIINTFTSLKLFEVYFKMDNQDVTQTEEETEINFIKAYLSQNSVFIKKQLEGMNRCEQFEQKDTPDWFFWVMFAGSYPYYDKVQYKVFDTYIVQAIKACLFFDFASNNPELRPLIEELMIKFEFDGWNSYLKDVLGAMHVILKNQEVEGFLEITPIGGKSVLEKLVISDHESFDKDDFLALRGLPFYKTGEGKYRIIFELFALEKIFKGIYFFLREVNDARPKAERVKDLKGKIGKHFSEETLLYRVLGQIDFGKCIKIPGSKMEGKGYVDFYIRKKNIVMLFECKDFLIEAEKKQSFNPVVYDEEFKKTFLKDGHDRKAILQLLFHIEKILSQEFEFDMIVNPQDLYFYPVIITTDFQYDCPGLNQVVNKWFKREVQNLKSRNLSVEKILPLTIINIDALILYASEFRKNFYLYEIISNFIDFTDPLEVTDPSITFLDKSGSFSHYLINYMDKRKKKGVPELFHECTPLLFADQKSMEV